MEPGGFSSRIFRQYLWARTGNVVPGSSVEMATFLGNRRRLGGNFESQFGNLESRFQNANHSFEGWKSAFQSGGRQFFKQVEGIVFCVGRLAIASGVRQSLLNRVSISIF